METVCMQIGAVHFYNTETQFSACDEAVPDSCAGLRLQILLVPF
jgi:hypothetical protein